MNNFEYKSMNCKADEVKGVMLKCDNLDIECSDSVAIKRVIYPYTSRAGVKGTYIEFTASKSGYIKDNLSLSTLAIN